MIDKEIFSIFNDPTDGAVYRSRIRSMQETLDRTRSLDLAFDAFETNWNLFQKNKVIFRINKSRDKDEILELWEEFKELDKKTRV